MRKRIGAWLSYNRKQKGLSQQKLAEKMGIRQNTISSIEDGRWAITVDMLALFCEHLEIDLNKLFPNGNTES
jgi:Predicted transcriptional regulators